MLKRVRVGARRKHRPEELAAIEPGELDPMTVVVEAVTEVTTEVVDALGRLVRQLSRSAPVPGVEELREIVASRATELLVARDVSNGVVGSLTLVVFRTPTGLRAWIEDVVVDGAARGRGVGELLNRHAVQLAIERGVRSVDLTSRSSREAANRLYRRLGFLARDTNVYRLDVVPPQSGESGGSGSGPPE